MTSAQAGLVLQHVRRLGPPGRSAGPSDGQLLECFVGQRDEAAFAALLRRHGPMVLNVCRSVLRHEQDAEDAFQATFLVLARKADTIARPEALAGWLHEVAHRAAVAAQADAGRRGGERRAWADSAPGAVCRAGLLSRFPFQAAPGINPTVVSPRHGGCPCPGAC